MSDAANGQGRVTVALNEVAGGAAGDGFFVGTWTATFTDAAKNAAGEVGGAASGTTARLFLTRTPPLVCGTGGPSFGLGSFFAPALRLDGTTMTGSYDYLGCEGQTLGRLTLSKQ